MWESVLNGSKFEIQANAEGKVVRLCIKKEQPAVDPAMLHLNENELFEVMHTLLTINRSFNHRWNYFDEQEPGS